MTVPRIEEFDSTVALLREGYTFMPARFARTGSDIFRTRLMLRRVTCMRGGAAARAFYGEPTLTRRGAMPAMTMKLLQDFGSVQTLDGAAHRQRKALFVGAAQDGGIAIVRPLFAEAWARALSRSAGRDIDLLDFSAGVLTETALRWCGLDASDDQIARRCDEMTAMIAGAGGIGLAQLRGQLRRARSERWARRRVRDRGAPPSGPLGDILAHRDASGAPLSDDVAAVELLNIIRPVVAISRFVAFAGHAMRVVPGLHDQVRDGSDAFRQSVAQEVRRYYPFFPAVGARATRRVTLVGCAFEPGDWLLLDIFGTNRHPDEWRDGQSFQPDRFMAQDWRSTPLCAQGAGDDLQGHRCPGEALTIRILADATKLIADAPFAPLGGPSSVPLDRMPTRPAPGLRFAVRPR